MSILKTKTLNAIKKIEKQMALRNSQLKFYNDFMKKLPGLSLGKAISEYTETYNLPDEQIAEDTRFALREHISEFTSDSFAVIFTVKADEVDSLFEVDTEAN